MTGFYRFGKAVNEVNTDALLRYSDDMLNEAVEGLSCMDEENMREPEDAKISDYDSVTGSYSIIKEDEGTELQEDKVKRRSPLRSCPWRRAWTSRSRDVIWLLR